MRKFQLLVLFATFSVNACSSTGSPSSQPDGAVSSVTTPIASLAPTPDSTDAPLVSEPEATEPETTEPATTEPVVPVATDATTGTAGAADDVYFEPTSWICRADTKDVCDEPGGVSVVAPDGTIAVQPSTPAADAPVDCFYVYPTISADPAFNSDMSADSELGAVIFQAQRFNQVCKVYAPVYRSVTLAGLSGAVKAQANEGWQVAYADVLAAWRHYLANDNGGRPVVLLSHSQGSFHLATLLREEIDPNSDQRDLIVSAILAGASFQVAPGKDVGGDTQQMPLCREADQFGCVITFQSYRDEVPPQTGALFGAPKGTTESACINPAALAGGPAILKSAMPQGDWVFADPTAAKLSTGFVDVPGLITGECKVLDGYSYLSITVNADPADARGDDITGDGSPNWGLHGVDINLVQGSLIDLVRSQTEAYLAG
jgi:hypothetical protein